MNNPTDSSNPSNQDISSSSNVSSNPAELLDLVDEALEALDNEDLARAEEIAEQLSSSESAPET